jgi:hypothetical protein
MRSVHYHPYHSHSQTSVLRVHSPTVPTHSYDGVVHIHPDHHVYDGINDMPIDQVCVCERCMLLGDTFPLALLCISPCTRA